MTYWDIVGDPLYFPTPLPNCQCHVSFRRYSPLSLKVIKNPNKCKLCWSQFFGKEDPNFSTADCRRDLLSIVWQSLLSFCLLISVCKAWQWSRRQNLRKVGKNSGPILSHWWIKVLNILLGHRRPLVVSYPARLSGCLYHVYLRYLFYLPNPSHQFNFFSL